MDFGSIVLRYKNFGGEKEILIPAIFFASQTITFMKPITNYIWLPHIIRKLLIKHKVEPYEVEEIFENNPRIRFLEKGHQKDENVYIALGQTDAGRYLTVIFIHKLDGTAMITSAYDMPDRHKSIYERK